MTGLGRFFKFHQRSTSSPPRLEGAVDAQSFHDDLWAQDVGAVRTRLDAAAPATLAELLVCELPAPHGRLRRPLMVAADVGNAELATLLLDRGCHCDQANSVGVSALFVAAQEGHEAVVLLLLLRGAKPAICRITDQATPILLSAQHGHDACVRLLLAADDNPNAQASNGIMPLWSACLRAHHSMIVVLVAGGADVNLATFGETPCRCLFQCAYNDQRLLGKMLYALGARLSEAECEFPLRKPETQHVWRRIYSGEDVDDETRASVLEMLAEERETQFGVRVRYHWLRLKPKLETLCLGLVVLDLPALVTQTIFEQSDDEAALIPSHRSWSVITRVKHFLSIEQKALRWH